MRPELERTPLGSGPLPSPIPVLLYHGIGEGVGETPAALFDAHLCWLSRHGYEGLTLPRFESVLRGQEALSPRSVLITFDDGLSSLATTAWPLLEKHRMPATAFVIASRVAEEAGGDYVSWRQLRQMRAGGLLACQSHSSTHARWERIENRDQQLKVLAADLQTSRQLLASRLGAELGEFIHIAWPWGSCNTAWEQLATECGFQFQYLVQTAAVCQQGEFTRLPRLCCDQLSLPAFALRMNLLSRHPAAAWTNMLSAAWRRRGGRIGYLSK